MYAIIRTGGKQWRVSQGDVIRVEHLTGDVGKQVRFEEVLFVGNGSEIRVGTPLVPEALVVGTITQQGKAAKVLVFKFKRRKKYRRTRGHRQLFTQVRIEKIELTAPVERKRKKATAPAKEAKAAVKKPTKKKEAKKPAKERIPKEKIKKEAKGEAKKPVRKKEPARKAGPTPSKTKTPKKKGQVKE